MFAYGSGSEDDVPLSSRMFKQEVKEEKKYEPVLQAMEYSNDGSSSDDDVPLAVQLKKSLKARSAGIKKPAPRRKTVKTPQKKASAPKAGTTKAVAEKATTSKSGTPKTAAAKKSGETKPKPKPKAKKSTKPPVKRTPKVKKDDDIPTKKFELPGQRKETPPDNDPSRLFYQSMYHEKKSLGKQSQIADVWMVRNGLLESEIAQRIMGKWGFK